jgi:ATP-grasp domain
MRVLLSEGSSTSAREAITALGLAGHRVEICDPDQRCLGRFSRFVHRFHHCPPYRTQPQAYLTFVLDLLSTGRFDVLLPIHEQGLVFAKVQDQITTASVALPSFESYLTAVDKGKFSRTLSELDIPQPVTRRTSAAHAATIQLPFVVKLPIGTASRAIWTVRSEAEREQVLVEFKGLQREVLIQVLLDGPVEHAQAVFATGRLVAMSGYRQIVRGAGGGEAIKESVWRPEVRAHLEIVGRHLLWHGALSVDYIWQGERPWYIDCNPRLVEPMAAYYAGVDLIGALINVSLDETPQEANIPRVGVRTHLGMQALLGAATRTGSRRSIISEAWQLACGSGSYTSSIEELTPVFLDPPSLLPLATVAVLLTLNPALGGTLSVQGWGAHLLDENTVRIIQEEL